MDKYGRLYLRRQAGATNCWWQNALLRERVLCPIPGTPGKLTSDRSDPFGILVWESEVVSPELNARIPAERLIC